VRVSGGGGDAGLLCRVKIGGKGSKWLGLGLPSALGGGVHPLEQGGKRER
jgi:hypothetical protein